MPHFPCYSSANVYIAPYSSATDGGELVTEFNQRAALNTVGYSVVDLTKGSSAFVAKLNQLNLTRSRSHSTQQEKSSTRCTRTALSSS